jgi:hypothetical protein
VVVLTFIFCIFLKLMICHIVIGCYKMTDLHHDQDMRFLQKKKKTKVGPFGLAGGYGPLAVLVRPAQRAFDLFL